MKIRINYSTLQGCTPEPDPSFEDTFANQGAAIAEARKRANHDCRLALLLDVENDYEELATIGV